jgi:hypothetical protein
LKTVDFPAHGADESHVSLAHFEIQIGENVQAAEVLTPW